MFLRTLRIVLFAILTSSICLAESNGYVNLNGTPSFVSKDGKDIIIGTEGDDDFKVVQNQVTTFAIDGATGAITSSGTFTPKLPNNTFIKSRNVADSADIEILGVNTNNATQLKSSSTTEVQIRPRNDANRQFIFDAASDTALNLTFGDGGATASQKIYLAGTTLNADDDSVFCASGGGTCEDAARGSYIYLAGADVGGANLGDAQVAASDDFYISTGVSGAIRLTINESGLWTVGAGDIGFGTSGNTIALQEATAGAACSGTLTFNGATPVVTSTTCATTGSRIFFTRTSAESTALNPYVSAISNGVSFSVTSEAGDTGTANWVIFHESAG